MRRILPMHPLLWPTVVKEEPHWGARFGRVLHWLFAALAAWLMVYAVWLIISTPSYESTYGAWVCLGLGAGLFIFARALRYVFSSE